MIDQNDLSPNKYYYYKKPTIWKRFRIELTILGIGVLAANGIFISVVFRATDSVNAAAAGQLGDFVGGYVGTYFALASTLLLYSTFKMQRNASMLETFQNKYFELLKMHRENAAEMSVGGKEGRKIFVLLIREFRGIHKIVKETALDQELAYSPKELFIASYNVLLYGVGPNSSRMLINSFEEEGFNREFAIEIEKRLNNFEAKNKFMNQRKTSYVPFEGHQSRLDHYYRHLFQSLRFVDDQEIDIDKYQYAKIIRAQLTVHEQALLFIYSLTKNGKIWWGEEQDFWLGIDLSKMFQRYFLMPTPK